MRSMLLHRATTAIKRYMPNLLFKTTRRIRFGCLLKETFIQPLFFGLKGWFICPGVRRFQ